VTLSFNRYLCEITRVHFFFLLKQIDPQLELGDRLALGTLLPLEPCLEVRSSADQVEIVLDYPVHEGVDRACLRWRSEGPAFRGHALSQPDGRKGHQNQSVEDVEPTSDLHAKVLPRTRNLVMRENEYDNESE
jgi:hypothetical protein